MDPPPEIKGHEDAILVLLLLQRVLAISTATATSTTITMATAIANAIVVPLKRLNRDSSFGGEVKP